MLNLLNCPSLSDRWKWLLTWIMTNGNGCWNIIGNQKALRLSGGNGLKRSGLQLQAGCQFAASAINYQLYKHFWATLCSRLRTLMENKYHVYESYRKNLIVSKDLFFAIHSPLFPPCDCSFAIPAAKGLIIFCWWENCDIGHDFSDF